VPPVPASTRACTKSVALSPAAIVPTFHAPDGASYAPRLGTSVT
jgi:hypothetical protein